MGKSAGWAQHYVLDPRKGWRWRLLPLRKPTSQYAPDESKRTIATGLHAQAIPLQYSCITIFDETKPFMLSWWKCQQKSRGEANRKAVWPSEDTNSTFHVTSTRDIFRNVSWVGRLAGTNSHHDATTVVLIGLRRTQYIFYVVLICGWLVPGSTGPCHAHQEISFMLVRQFSPHFLTE
jgi:hypothetical protein